MPKVTQLTLTNDILHPDLCSHSALHVITTSETSPTVACFLEDTPL